MRLPSLCAVDSPLWQRVVDDLCQTRAATQRIPPPLPSVHAAHQVAGQSHQHRGPGACWEGVRRVGRVLLRCKDVIKQDLRSALINTSALEDIANHQETWRQSVTVGVSKAEVNA